MGGPKPRNGGTPKGGTPKGGTPKSGEYFQIICPINRLPYIVSLAHWHTFEAQVSAVPQKARAPPWYDVWCCHLPSVPNCLNFSAFSKTDLAHAFFDVETFPHSTQELVRTKRCPQLPSGRLLLDQRPPLWSGAPLLRHASVALHCNTSCTS